VKVKTLGIDLAKETFGLHGVDALGRVAVHRRVTRKQLLGFLVKLEPCLVGMEACGSAHYWAREIEKLGHTVKLMSPQFVIPYRKGNKNDPNDAEAICEAVSRPSMRFVPIKNEEQQDLQALHRVREQLVKNRTALANQIRGLLRERGVVVAQAIARLRAALPVILEDQSNRLSALMRELLGEMAERLRMFDDRLRQYDERIARVCQQDERCRRLVKVEGVGPLVATAVVGAIGLRGSSPTAASSAPGWGRCRASTPAATARYCLASASAAIVTCARCSSTGHGPPHGWPSANATRAVSG